MEILIFIGIVSLIIGLAIYFICKSGIITDTVKLVEKGVELTKENVGGVNSNIKKKTSKFTEKVDKMYHEKFGEKTKTQPNTFTKDKTLHETVRESRGSIDHMLPTDHKTINRPIKPDQLNYIWSTIISRRRIGCFNCKSTDMFQMGGDGYDDYMRLQCPKCGQKAKIRIKSNSKEGVDCINLGKMEV